MMSEVVDMSKNLAWKMGEWQRYTLSERIRGIAEAMDLRGDRVNNLWLREKADEVEVLEAELELCRAEVGGTQ